MDKSELETMRKSFNTVKRRSDSIKNSPSTLRLKKRVSEIKKESIKNNEHYLKQAIESFKRNDIEVRIAETCDDALKFIDELLLECGASAVAKAKSNTLGEIDLKAHLADKNIEVVETDLGDRILQLKKTDNKPVHPTGPASHLNVSSIKDIVNESLLRPDRCTDSGQHSQPYLLLARYIYLFRSRNLRYRSVSRCSLRC